VWHIVLLININWYQMYEKYCALESISSINCANHCNRKQNMDNYYANWTCSQLQALCFCLLTKSIMSM
jgi:hypothetical protein